MVTPSEPWAFSSNQFQGLWPENGGPSDDGVVWCLWQEQNAWIFKGKRLSLTFDLSCFCISTNLDFGTAV